jgi:hypothetical protein
LSDERREEEPRERDELVENGQSLFDRVGRFSPLPVVPVFMLVPLLLR